MINLINKYYQSLITCLYQTGDRIHTRNHAVYSLIETPSIIVNSTPLITVKKTAWRKALREMEWFLSGSDRCPDELLDWWGEQILTLESGSYYRCGYAHQLRHFGQCEGVSGFDQIAELIHSITHHPYSRRHVITTWSPREMSMIPLLNQNKDAPATCHGTIVQAFVRNSQLHLKTYQRSADVLLGVPHNLIQYWALLLWLCNQCDLTPGTLSWVFGDVHLYDEPSHIAVARQIIDARVVFDARSVEARVDLKYCGNKEAFKMSDFEMEGDIPEPVTTLRAKLL